MIGFFSTERSAFRAIFCLLAGLHLLAGAILVSAQEPAAQSSQAQTSPILKWSHDRPIPSVFSRELRFLQAVSNDDREVIARALELGVSIKVTDDLQRDAIVLATINVGSVELVDYLHRLGAPIDGIDRRNRSALSFAASRGHLSIAQYLIEAGAQVDRADRRGRTPLLYAAGQGHLDIVDVLLDRGAAIDHRDQFGDSPLMVSCAKGFAAVVDRLLDRGANPRLTDQENRLPVDRAAPSCKARLSMSPEVGSAASRSL